MITIENLQKSFGAAEVLKGASLEIRDKEIVALIGPSGDGKSVFLKHVAGLLQPDSGRIVFNGKDLCGLRRAELVELRGRFGFLFQNGALFDSMTVYDNVAFPLREKTRLKEKEVRERVLGELQQVGLEGAEDKYPAQLSGGMAKRAALARALVRPPEIMLFDEPTTGLDPIIVHSIHALIAATHKRLGSAESLCPTKSPESSRSFSGWPSCMRASSDLWARRRRSSRPAIPSYEILSGEVCLRSRSAIRRRIQSSQAWKNILNSGGPPLAARRWPVWRKRQPYTILWRAPPGD